MNHVGRDDYEHFVSSGLYERLVADGLLVPHEEVPGPFAVPATGHKVLRPELLPFISYPYEWCFGQLKAAALATLRIQRLALERGMILKDASAFNVQFRGAAPVFIDTLSFARHDASRPWVGYGQFCRHFLAPLALVAATDHRLGQLARTFLDGVPLDLASRLLPRSTWLRFGLLSHLHLHARAETRAATAPDAAARARAATVRSTAIEALTDHLERTVAALDWRPRASEWLGYYGETNYSPAAMTRKEAVIAEWLERTAPRRVWDLGANVGRFSRLAADRGAFTVAFDVDAAAVDAHYRDCVAAARHDVLPLVSDLVNPSPALGWHHHERQSLCERGPADLVLALALVHHLAIGNNVPLDGIARFFADVGRHLIVELVPKGDSQITRMLATRADIFADYSREGFERAFAPYFTVHATVDLPDSTRTLYLMERRAA